MPPGDKVATCLGAISCKYPLLKDVWGAMDSLKDYIQASGNDHAQNTFYNRLFSHDAQLGVCHTIWLHVADYATLQLFNG